MPEGGGGDQEEVEEVNREALQARFPGIGFGDKVPSEIMIMPGGETEITARQGDAPVTLRVNIGPDAAVALQIALEALRAEAGVGRRPFFDFDHKDEAASGWPLSFEWRDSPPGVYGRVEWSKAGADAIQGGMYRAFSPTFFITPEGRVSGAPLNMGGLVNQPAFGGILPLWAKATKTENDMITEEKLAEFKTLLASVLTALNEVKAKLSAPNTSVLAMETQIASLTESQKLQAKTFATDEVRKAIQAGKIPPQCQQLIDHWTTAIIVDPSAAEALQKLPPNPILQASLTANNRGALNAVDATAHGFAALVKAKYADLKDKAKSIAAAVAENPDGYAAWRKANGDPAIFEKQR